MRLKIGAAVVCAALLLSACGASRGAQDGGQPAGTASHGTGANATGAGSAGFGTLSSPCGPGSAKGATDQGVTDTSIRIGYGDDRGFPAQRGLDREIGDAVRAMIAWCNEQGGIEGRRIKGDFYDAAVTQVHPVMQQACKADFMLVGEGFANDEAGEQTRMACGLPAVPAFAVGPDVRNAPMMYTPAPIPSDYQPGGFLFQLAQRFPETKSAFALLDTTLPVNPSIDAKLIPAVKAAGFTIIDCGVRVSYTGEANFVPFAERFKRCGAKVIFLPINPGPVIYNFIAAMNQIGEHPIYVMQRNGYTPDFAGWNTSGLADKLYTGMEFQPLENAGTVPAVKQYLDLVKASGGQPGMLGMAGASAFLLWAEAAKQCGSSLTRQCMVNKLAAVHKWTAGGLQAPSDPGSNLPAPCVVLLNLHRNEWRQVAPSKAGEFVCESKYNVKDPSSAWGSPLNSDRLDPRFLGPHVLLPQ